MGRTRSCWRRSDRWVWNIFCGFFGSKRIFHKNIGWPSVVSSIFLRWNQSPFSNIFGSVGLESLEARNQVRTCSAWWNWTVFMSSLKAQNLDWWWIPWWILFWKGRRNINMCFQVPTYEYCLHWLYDKTFPKHQTFRANPSCRWKQAVSRLRKRSSSLLSHRHILSACLRAIRNQGFRPFCMLMAMMLDDPEPANCCEPHGLKWSILCKVQCPRAMD